MREHARAREAARFLQNEYGQDTFVVTKDGAEPVVLPWAKVQRRVAQLMDMGQLAAVEEPVIAAEPVIAEEPASVGEAAVEAEPAPIEELASATEPEKPSPQAEQPAVPTEPEATISPNPVFLRDKNDIHSMDLSQYSDGDILGYDKNGVEYGVTRMGEHTFISSTTRITPMGDIIGMADIPADILRQIRIANGLESPKTEQETVYERFLAAKEQYPGHIVMVKLGDFFEFHGVDAQYMAETFGYTAVSRNINGQDIPLVGIPDKGTDTLDLAARLNYRGRDVVLIDGDGAVTEYPKAEPVAVTEQPEQSSPVLPILETSSEPYERVNFRITDDHLGEGGAKSKFRANMDAIKTLHNIELENRLATPEEQQILSRYVGWGGLPQAFDPDNKQWKNEYLELKAALSPTDYDMARASTLNAHYTSPTVIKAMYETLERLGFKDGNLLEPACGVGNFFGLLPESMRNAKLYGVELDSITGRIAKQLYQNADIQIKGFEKTDTPDAFFDVAVGNVPFGSYKLADRRYDKQNFLIHDYFFAKALDQVRPGGIVAFITSKGTLDKANPEVRKYIAQRAELLGAVRLPNNAFLKNAGTEVTSDIIFLQKRDRLIDIQPDWVYLGQLTVDSGQWTVPVNSYFVDHPEMILGTMAYDDRMYGNGKETTCNPIEGADLSEQLREALSHIQGQITEYELDDIEGIQDVSIPADPSVRNFSYAIVDDTVYYRENSRMNPVDMPATTLERVKGMAGLRDCVRELIDYQLYDYPDSDIQAKQAELNTLYDAFSRKYGLINDGANNKAFSADSAYYLLCSLEILDENGKLERKSDDEHPNRA